MNFQDAFARPAPKPNPAEEARLAMLRQSFPSLCFEHAGSIYPKHAWSPNGTCTRCQAKLRAAA